MSWVSETTKTWVDRLSAAFEAWLPGVDARLARNNIGPTATAVGGAMWQIDAKIEDIARDRFVHMAGEDALIRHGADFSLPRRAASKATGDVAATTDGAVTVDKGAVLRRADGVRFSVVSGASIAGSGVLTLSVRAVEAGAAGNTAAGSTLVALSGVDGEATFVVGAAGLVGGDEIEDKEVYRARLLQRLAYPPQGGTTSDYWRWATSVDGCSDCWVWPRRGGVGRVSLFPVFDGRRNGGRPTAAELAAVREAVEASAPDGALISVTAFTPVVVDVRIPALSPSSREVRDAIAAELANVFASRSRVAGSADAHPSFPMRATAFSFSRSWIEEAISRAVGEVRHGPVEPVEDVVLADGERAVLGNILFT